MNNMLFEGSSQSSGIKQSQIEITDYSVRLIVNHVVLFQMTYGPQYSGATFERVWELMGEVYKQAILKNETPRNP